MNKKDKIHREFQDLQNILESMPDLDRLVKCIESTSKDIKLAERHQKISLPYVSAEPIHGARWNQ